MRLSIILIVVSSSLLQSEGHDCHMFIFSHQYQKFWDGVHINGLKILCIFFCGKLAGTLRNPPFKYIDLLVKGNQYN